MCVLEGGVGGGTRASAFVNKCCFKRKGKKNVPKEKKNSGDLNTVVRPLLRKMDMALPS